MNSNSTTTTTETEPAVDPAKVLQMIQACQQGHLHMIQALLHEETGYACQQDESTGMSPLMAAASAGNGALCQLLLEHGAPWNALDRQGRCAGNFATTNQHWAVVQLLVDWAVKAELILGQLQKTQRKLQQQQTSDSSSTKPNYLQQPVEYTADGQSLLDQDRDAVMMEWERPLMQAHAQVLMMQNHNNSHNRNNNNGGGGKIILNVGFGLGIIDGILQQHDPPPAQHYIIEAHPDVYQRMLQEKWHEKPGVHALFGKWQDVLPQQLIAKGITFDGIFFDTYGEHYTDMQDFHNYLPHLLKKEPLSGVYSFFNGLAPDNLFFHGVACQCCKLELAQLGLDCEFWNCEIQQQQQDQRSAGQSQSQQGLLPDATSPVWQGIRRPYWHSRDTYYLPYVTWNADYLKSGGRIVTPVAASSDQKQKQQQQQTDDNNAKRPRVMMAMEE